MPLKQEAVHTLQLVCKCAQPLSCTHRKCNRCLPAATLPPSSVMCFQYLRVGHWAVGALTNKWYLIISLVPRTGWHLCMFSGWDVNKILFLFVNLKRGKKFLSLCMIHALHNTLCYAACWDQFPIFKFALTRFKAVRLQKRSIGGPVKCWGWGNMSANPGAFMHVSFFQCFLVMPRTPGSA